MTSGWACNASLWSRVCELADEIGTDLIKVVKVKAHAKLHSSMGQYEKLCVVANGYADKGARWGADKHPGSAEQRKVFSQFRTAYTTVCKFLVATVIESFKFRPKPDKGSEKALRPPAVAPIDQHLTFWNPSSPRFQCTLCYSSGKKDLKGKCGFFTGKAYSHNMWGLGPFSYCSQCGAYTSVARRRLAQLCPGKVTTKAMAIALDRLKHGLHPVTAVFIGVPSPLFCSAPPADLPEEEDSD